MQDLRSTRDKLRIIHDLGICNLQYVEIQVREMMLHPLFERQNASLQNKLCDLDMNCVSTPEYKDTDAVQIMSNQVRPLYTRILSYSFITFFRIRSHFIGSWLFIY